MYFILPLAVEQAGDTMKVYFGKGVSAIAPGQAAVFYEGDDVIGGGVDYVQLPAGG